jgi:nitrogen-specific signal transduction histidine kinase
MGLAVSQSIVRDHDGEIAFETSSNGTRFHVLLPMKVPPVTTSSPLPAAETAA